ncbi:MAG: hypothetical protein Q7O66_10550, partial [Dehalococcoidia bacterium]|nr:hypothetical protein [Dehalococcoidia bacterium]
MMPEPYDVKMDDRAVAIEEHQSRLPGIRVRPLSKEGCPHCYGRKDWVDSCDLNEGRPCVYETSEAEQGCDVFREILREIEEDMGLRR